MAESLESYHVNTIKVGAVLRQMAKEKHISQEKMSAKTGLSYDTVGNIYAGKTQKLPLEYFMKICIILETSFESMILLMLKDEDIDFADRILTYDARKDIEVPVLDVLPSMTPGVVPDAVTDTAAAVTIATSAMDAAPMSEVAHTDDLKPIVDAIRHEYEAHIADLKEQLASERAANAIHAEQLHSLAMGILQKER